VSCAAPLLLLLLSYRYSLQNIVRETVIYLNVTYEAYATCLLVLGLTEYNVIGILVTKTRNHWKDELSIANANISIRIYTVSQKKGPPCNSL